MGWCNRASSTHLLSSPSPSRLLDNITTGHKGHSPTTAAISFSQTGKLSDFFTAERMDLENSPNKRTRKTSPRLQRPSSDLQSEYFLVHQNQISEVLWEHFASTGVRSKGQISNWLLNGTPKQLSLQAKTFGGIIRAQKGTGAPTTTPTDRLQQLVRANETTLVDCSRLDIMRKHEVRDLTTGGFRYNGGKSTEIQVSYSSSIFYQTKSRCSLTDVNLRQSHATIRRLEWHLYEPYSIWASLGLPNRTVQHPYLRQYLKLLAKYSAGTK
ncbi:hypothetical protein BJ508DRAFT_375058 [Ascobolus immersus RN42]|uniref:Uncharacterized protein n=1 Tax=Ascobolus immersus RN42 TaxID=1160509 RepID=A0A3N4IPI0_ASCIM|nr:hypothetical protein BJ508DRAFT_375058 [Ascobolus immersus RN42]